MNKILIAEDDLLNQLLVKEILKNSEHELIFVDNGRSAMEELEKERFDLVLVDIEMPIMDGFETIKAIRAHGNSKISKIPIIAMTAHFMSEELEKIKKSGANDIAIKPFKRDQVIGSIHAQLSNGHSSDQLKVLDLGQIQVISDGNRSVEKSFLKTFAQQMKESLEKLFLARTEKDDQKVKRIMHKMSNSFEMFKMPMREEVYELSENKKMELDNESGSIDRIIAISKKGIQEAETLCK